MDSLDFNLHRLILTKLASTVVTSSDDASSGKAMEAISSRVKVRDLADETCMDERTTMVRVNWLSLFPDANYPSSLRLVLNAILRSGKLQ